MSTPFISYLVTCKNTGYSLQILLERLSKYSENNECIILDDYSDDDDTLQVLENLSNSNLTELPDLSRFYNLQVLICNKNFLTIIKNLPETLLVLICKFVE